MASKVLIQGFEGSFHQMAAEKYFNKKIKLGFCKSFKTIFDEMKNTAHNDVAVIAIENSIAGSILNNYSLLKNSNLSITGEIYLTVKQNLIANKGVQLSDIKEIHSHPMALFQCADYLDKHNWKLVETEDTALSIKHIKEQKSKNIAGIASTLASTLFNMQILKSDIQSMKENFTRFLILKHTKKNHNKTDNKASIQFELNDKMGSLAQVLNRIYYHNINLSKLQSFPVPESKWNYFFHTDMEFNNIDDFNNAMEDIKRVTKNIKIYGIYEKGNTI